LVSENLICGIKRNSLRTAKKTSEIDFRIIISEQTASNYFPTIHLIIIIATMYSKNNHATVLLFSFYRKEETQTD